MLITLDHINPIYAVSDAGTIFNIKTGRMKSARKFQNGYLAVSLYSPKKKKPETFYVHHLVAKAFHKNTEGKKCIDHINRIKTDNRAFNLRFATHRENALNCARSDHLLNQPLVVKP